MRATRIVLIAATVVGSWFGMQTVHELGHVLGALWTSARVDRVVLHPLTISRTDVSENLHPLVVVWAGPLVGVLLPAIAWATAIGLNFRGAFVLRFFAGFCLIANGLYIAVGSFWRIGDCGDMLRNGSSNWQLWLFGVITVPLGLLAWHRQGVNFGVGANSRHVDSIVAYATLGLCVTLIAFAFLIGGK